MSLTQLSFKIYYTSSSFIEQIALANNTPAYRYSVCFVRIYPAPRVMPSYSTIFPSYTLVIIYLFITILVFSSLSC